jgi:hypothetical protein
VPPYDAQEHQLEVFERSYFTLARGAQVLARSTVVQEALERQGK